MTREKAIKILTHIRNGKSDLMLMDALDMAIKALEQEPYEKFENVKDHIYKLAGDYKCWDNRLTDDEAVELYHILEQEPKTGHWIDGDRTKWKCSNCEYGVLDWNNTPYCPNCGARMRGENQNDN